MDTIRTKRHKRLIELLVEERKRSGTRQVDLAKRLRKTQSWVARLESGERRVDMVEFLMLAEAIGFDPCKIVRTVSQILAR